MNYFDRFSINLQKAIKLSVDAAKYYGSNYIGSEHILFGILNVPECRAAKILKSAGVTEPEYRSAFVRTLDKHIKISGFTPRTKNMFEKASEYAINHDGTGASVGSEYMLLAIIMDEDSVAVRLLKSPGADIDQIVGELDEEMGYVEDDDDYEEPPVFRASPFMKNMAHEPAGVGAPQQGGKAKEGLNFRFGTDLTQKAREGKIDPVIGRKKRDR